MLTTNYNVVQVSSNDKEKYNIGDIFKVPEHKKNDSRCMKFDGLEIEEITFGFGIFLHFNWQKWYDNNPSYPERVTKLFYEGMVLKIEG
jgi:hypothetical protein